MAIELPISSSRCTRRGFGMVLVLIRFPDKCLSCLVDETMQFTNNPTEQALHMMSSTSLSSGLPAGGLRSNSLDTMRKETEWLQTQTP